MIRRQPMSFLSLAARSDLYHIEDYTDDHFGPAQAEKTMNAIEARLDELAHHPDLGHGREDLDPPGKSFLYQTVLKRYMIVYSKAPEGIRVVRILDGARQVRDQLHENPGDVFE